MLRRQFYTVIAVEVYRSALATAIADVETNIEFLEEIYEAWAIPYGDKSLVAQIQEALSKISSKKNEKDIPDWRETLGALLD